MAGQTTAFTPTERRWPQPMVRKELSDSLHNRSETELSGMLSSDCGHSMPLFERPKLQHSRNQEPRLASVVKHAVNAIVRRAADLDDSHLTCGCGFTCGTPSAMNRHQKRCSLAVRSAPASPAAVDKAFEVQLRKRFGSEPSAAVVDKAAFSRIAEEAEAETRSSLRFLLVRHGESANRTLSCTTHRNPVAAVGDLQIWCSPMLRCLQTIKPTMDVLDLPQSKCICHGACYEHGCAGLSFEGASAFWRRSTPAAKIEEQFPNFQFMGSTLSHAERKLCCDIWLEHLMACQIFLLASGLGAVEHSDISLHAACTMFAAQYS
eukprot:s767_g10.t1